MADWHREALRLHTEQGLGAQRISDELGESFSAVNNFLYRWRKKHRKVEINQRVEGQEEQKPDYVDHGDYYIVYSGKREVAITKDKLRYLKQLYCEQKLTINQTCRELDIPRAEFMLVKNAFGITKDDVPFLDEDLTGDVDGLVQQSLERLKRQYFIKLQQKEVEALRREVLKYRQEDYLVSKIHQLVTEHDWQIDIQKVQRNTSVIPGLMLEVPIVDLHIAKLAWAPETGHNYDTKIAKKRFMNVIDDVVKRSAGMDFEQVIFPVGNDFFNYDDIAGSTTAGTRQDNDSRWQRMFTDGCELLIAAIDILSKIAPIKVFQIPGNHDTMTSFYAIALLHAWFRNNDNVEVDINPSTRKYVEFGKNLIGFTHGDKEGRRLFGNMQVEAAEAWGRTLYREWHTGHLHSEHVKEEHGVKVRRLSSVVSPDAWHAQMGYVGAIATSQSFVWCAERGLREIWYSNVVL